MGFSIWIVFINLNNVVHFLVGSKCHSFNSETRGLSLQPINLWFELCVTERHCLVLDIRLISRGGCVPRLCLFFMQSETRPQRVQLCGCPAKLKCVSFFFCPSTIGQKGRAILLKIAEWNQRLRPQISIRSGAPVCLLQLADCRGIMSVSGHERDQK